MLKLMPNVSLKETKSSTIEAFGKELQKLGKENSKIVALTADLKGSVKLGYFESEFPDRFFDAGIAEQNMIGMAAGLAKGGLIPFPATFSVFSSLRAAEQIHTDVCYQNLNVKIVGTHGGTSFAAGGATHHAIEDIAVMRNMANMTVVCPADSRETVLATRAAVNNYGPFFIRLNRGTDYDIYDSEDFEFTIGKAIKLSEGNDLTLIACGACIYQSLQAAKILNEKYSLNVRVLDMHTIKPIDKEAIINAAEETKNIITVEDHTIIGGLGSAVAEVLAEHGTACKFKRLGIQDTFSPTGNRDDLLAFHGINSDGILKTATDMLGLA